MTRDHHPEGLPRIKAVLLLLILAALVVFTACGETNPLPARNWNRLNLEQIKAPEGRPLTFAVLADNRGNPEVFTRILRQINQDPDITFVLHLGDMVHDADVAKYRLFFQYLKENFHKPLLTVIGNHELHGKDALKLYHQIFGPDYYSFKVKESYFIAVNDASKTGLGKEQQQWLYQELQKAQDYPTKIVLLHIPLFDPQPDPKHISSLPPERGQELVDLFKKYRVTHVFAAHKHSYFAGDWQGIPYSITAGAGAKLYGNDPGHFFYHYLKVSVDGGKIDVQVKRLEGE